MRRTDELRIGPAGRLCSTQVQCNTAAQAVLGAGRYPEAKAAFVDLCKLEPNVAEVHANPGAIYFQEAKFDQAILALRKALDLRSALARASTLLALSLSELVNHVYVAESTATRGPQC
jgi:Flp pilus assembly protein TadD